MGQDHRHTDFFKELLQHHPQFQRSGGTMSGLLAPEGFLYPDEKNRPEGRCGKHKGNAL